jgi:hypothetical protein
VAAESRGGGKLLLEVPGYKFQALVTNLPPSVSPLQVWFEYNGRAGIENVIKELRHGFALPDLCCQKFFATEAALSLAGLHLQPDGALCPPSRLAGKGDHRDLAPPALSQRRDPQLEPGPHHPAPRHSTRPTSLVGAALAQTLEPFSQLQCSCPKALTRPRTPTATALLRLSGAEAGKAGGAQSKDPVTLKQRSAQRREHHVVRSGLLPDLPRGVGCAARIFPALSRKSSALRLRAQ